MAKTAQTKEHKQKRKRVPLADRKRIQKLTLMDDDFMSICLKNDIPAAQEMLRVILNKKDLIVKSVKTQEHFQGVKRSVRLDIFAEDSLGEPINIEIQNASEGAEPRRARFHSAVIDVHSLEMGQDFEELPDRYVIFITREDVLGLGKLIYTIHQYIDGDLVPFEDGGHVIYINVSAENDGSELWKLAHDLQCPDPDEMYFPRLAARARFLKQTEEGVKHMSGVFEEIRREAEAKVEAKAEKKAAKQIKAAEKKAEQATKQAEQATKQAEQATKQAEQATKQFEQAEKKAEQAERQAQESLALRMLQNGESREKTALYSGLSMARVRKLAQGMA